jgi:phage portal protein BeeE
MSSMPVYRTRGAEILSPATWMENPDPSIYSSWSEFAHQLFWDWWVGEAFVLSMARFSDEFPSTFRVVPPWMIHVEVGGSGRTYRLGGPAGTDVTGDVCHIRYKSTTDGAHGVGPLESAGGRMLTAGVLAKYVREMVSTGGMPIYTLETDHELEGEDGQDILNEWVNTRAQNLGYPPVLHNGIKLKSQKGMSPKDMAMIEIAQFTEGRIADLLGVPRALVGLPTGDSFTYSNVSSWFDHHDRTTLRPAAKRVMPALSFWALPRGQAAELNRDEYSRPPFNERAEAAVKLIEVGALSIAEWRQSERITGEAPTAALTGVDQ